MTGGSCCYAQQACRPLLFSLFFFLFSVYFLFQRVYLFDKLALTQKYFAYLFRDNSLSIWFFYILIVLHYVINCFEGLNKMMTLVYYRLIKIYLFIYNWKQVFFLYQHNEAKTHQPSLLCI